MTKRTTRRRFLQQTAAGVTLPTILPRLGLAESANGRLQHAAIGVGGRGRGVLAGIGNTGKVDVVALCDVDENNLNEAAARRPGARKYRDWREMLAQEADKIDSVSISTPDHMHAPAMMAALQRGKHVYCEKPLTHEVYETRQVTLEARKAGVATQMGIQIHSHIAYRRAVQMLRDGVIGKVKEWHSWSAAKYGSKGRTRPEGEDAVPPHLAWDLWIGVAPFRPYKAGVYHPGRWRSWQDFGCGGLGDFGCHIFDPVFTALDIGAPLTVRGEIPEINDEVWPYWNIVYYEFPGTKMTTGKTIRATWYDSGKKPPRDLAPMPDDHNLPDSGSLIIGEEGVMVLPHYSDAVLYPVEKFTDYPVPKLGHVKHFGLWVDAALGEGEAPCNFDYSGPLTEAVLLGNVAVRVAGKTLEWDAANLRVTNCPEADALVRRPYREGWEVARSSA